MIRRPSRARILQVWRYYQAGVVNTAFGLSLYSLLVWLGIDMFVAQLTSHCIGVAFNYLSYSRHVFRRAPAARLRFALSYGLNYVLSLGTLVAMSRFIASPYVSGLLSVAIVSIINYFVLRHFVFRTAGA